MRGVCGLERGGSRSGVQKNTPSLPPDTTRREGNGKKADRQVTQSHVTQESRLATTTTTTTTRVHFDRATYPGQNTVPLTSSLPPLPPTPLRLGDVRIFVPRKPVHTQGGASTYCVGAPPPPLHMLLSHFFLSRSLLSFFPSFLFFLLATRFPVVHTTLASSLVPVAFPHTVTSLNFLPPSPPPPTHTSR